MNTEQTENNDIDLDVPHPGTVLKNARESMGLSVKDVADRLRLRVKVIEDLESNTDTDNQIPTFTRGYIRSYSKLLGLNADELLSGYVSDESAEPDVQQMQSFSRKTKMEKSDTHLMTLTWIILVAVIGLSAYWWWQDQNAKASDASASQITSQEPIAKDEQSEQPSESALPVTRIEPTSPSTDSVNEEDTTSGESISAIPVSDSVEAESVAVKEDAAVVTDTSADNNEIASVVDEQRTQNENETSSVLNSGSDESASQTPSSETSGLTPLVMSFSADCWIEVRDGSGKRLATGIKSPGDTLELAGTPPFKLVLGAPKAVKLTFDGKSVDMNSFPAGKVARFSLPK
ncbi:cytoskeleton protein RodZ [Veronia pacifica]|uniref:HTH cro/C1-type domain-containing protein n=1 Tax=Veronia pacifica TaxID=1080227 RepID=A0A1C3EGG3_9GAMM|nr:cytoskeleton protein RodZ [Veronia pacifica]ODA32318.1 hypothetical protein A8L45_13395 [Veronia pacifica]